MKISSISIDYKEKRNKVEIYISVDYCLKTKKDSLVLTENKTIVLYKKTKKQLKAEFKQSGLC